MEITSNDIENSIKMQKCVHYVLCAREQLSILLSFCEPLPNKWLCGVDRMQLNDVCSHGHANNPQWNGE